MTPSIFPWAGWHAVLTDLLRLGVAYLLAFPLGWNREHEQRSVGLRTFPIVAVAACGFVILGSAVPGTTSADISRILQGLITGIGFIGGGAILRDKRAVSGTATAASIWTIGIVGAAVGFGMYHIAAALAALNLVTFKALTPLKQKIDRETDEPSAGR